MNRLYDFTINTAAEKDELIIRFNDLMPNAQQKLSKILKNGSSINKVVESNIPIERVRSILRANNPVIWKHWSTFRSDYMKLSNYPIFRFKELALSRIIYYAIKETPMTERQKGRIYHHIETNKDLIKVHRMRNGLMQHPPGGMCRIYNCPICREESRHITERQTPNSIFNRFMDSSTTTKGQQT